MLEEWEYPGCRIFIFQMRVILSEDEDLDRLDISDILTSDVLYVLPIDMHGFVDAEFDLVVKDITANGGLRDDEDESILAGFIVSNKCLDDALADAETYLNDPNYSAQEYRQVKSDSYLLAFKSATWECDRCKKVEKGKPNTVFFQNVSNALCASCEVEVREVARAAVIDAVNVAIFGYAKGEGDGK